MVQYGQINLITPQIGNIHIETTAQEIWKQTDGTIDGFICSVGTGGTLAGTAHGLREKSKAIKIGLADPDGAALFNYYKMGS